MPLVVTAGSSRSRAPVACPGFTLRRRPRYPLRHVTAAACCTTVVTRLQRGTPYSSIPRPWVTASLYQLHGAARLPVTRPDAAVCMAQHGKIPSQLAIGSTRVCKHSYAVITSSRSGRNSGVRIGTTDEQRRERWRQLLKSSSFAKTSASSAGDGRSDGPTDDGIFSAVVLNIVELPAVRRI
jgi:hypothetical protein